MFGTDFSVRIAAGSVGATLTVTPDGVSAPGGRVITGVAYEEAISRYTPLALAVLSPPAVEFDVDWYCVA